MKEFLLEVLKHPIVGSGLKQDVNLILNKIDLREEKIELKLIDFNVSKSKIKNSCQRIITHK